MSIIVSIIMPSFNSEATIGRSIKSVVSQTFNNWELIIIDDCSKDLSHEVIKAHVKQDSRIKFINFEQNSGAAVARNVGIKNASGRFIAFLDSDDTWHPKKLEQQVMFMLKHEYAFTYTKYHQVNENGDRIGELYCPLRVNYRKLLNTCVIGCLTAMYDTHKLGKVYFPLNSTREDFALWLKILKEIDYAYCLSEDLASYTVRFNSSSANKFKAAKGNWHLYRKVEGLSIIVSSYYFLNYAIRGIIRTKFKKLSQNLKL